MLKMVWWSYLMKQLTKVIIIIILIFLSNIIFIKFEPKKIILKEYIINSRIDSRPSWTIDKWIEITKCRENAKEKLRNS